MPEENGRLTVDQAVGLLNAASGAAEAGTQPEPVEPEPSAAPEGSDIEPKPELAEQADAAEQEEQPLSPPTHWNADERELFSRAGREIQSALLAQEGKREGVLQRAKQEAQSARQAADDERTQINLRVQALDQLLPQAINTFQSRWANVDWATLPDQVGAEAAFRLKAQFDAEQSQLQRIHAAQQQAWTDAQRQFVQSEAQALGTVAPELVDQKEGRSRRLQLGQFLVAEGFPADRIALMSAKEASIAYDAMRWREAQKRAAAPKTKSPAQAAAQPRQAPAGVRPSAATGTRSPQNQRLDTLQRKGRLSVNEATELLNLRTPA